MEQAMTRIPAGQRTDALAERDWEANDPAEFRRLETGQQKALVDWIRAVLVPAKSIFRRNSYGMKQISRENRTASTSKTAPSRARC